MIMMMKHLLLLAFCAASVWCCGMETVIDFRHSAPPVGVHRAEEKAQSCTYIGPAEGKRVLRIDWDASRGRHFECGIGRTIPLPEFTRAEITIGAYLPPGTPLETLCLRLRDADGETWQFTGSPGKPDGGRREIIYSIDRAAPKADCWGGSGNRKLDFPVTLAGFAGNFRKRTGSSWCAVESVSIRVLGSDAPLTVRLETGNPVHVFPAGNAQAPELRIVNTRSRTISGELEYRLTSTAGTPEHRHRAAWRIEPGQEFRLELPRPEAFGVYYLDTSLTEEDGPIRKKRLSYAHMPPAGPTPGMARGFLFGICSHPKRGTYAEQEKEALAAALCGAKIVREDINWEQLQRTPQRINWAPFDDVVSIFGRQNIEIQAIYCYSPKWANAVDWKPLRLNTSTRGNPADEHWRKFIRSFAGRYRGRIRYVEVWNEPDLAGFANFSVDAYLDMLKSAYAETKTAAPEMTVLTAGFAGAGEHMRQTLKRGKGSFDVIAYHGHGPFPGYRSQVEKVLAMRNEAGSDAPWYANETGISSLHIGELEQAAVLYRKFLYSWARGAIGYNWYDLRNDGFDPGNNEHNFGLLTRDFHPKAAYAVYNMLALYFQNGEFIADADIGGTGSGFFFRGAGGDLLLPHWDEASRVLMFSGVTGKAFRVDLFGNETELAVRDGNLIAETGPLPSTLRFPGQKELPRLAGELVRMEEEFVCRPGHSSGLQLELFNPGKRELEFRFDVRLPKGLALRTPPETVRMAPGERQQLVLAVEANGAFHSFAGHEREIQIGITAGGDWTGKLACPVRSVTVLSGSGLPEKADFTLDRAGQLTMLAPNDPARAHLFWKGAEDLSAEVRLGREGKHLLLSVKVQDDVHCQPHRGESSWLGDSIQFALKLPGQQGFWEIGLSLPQSGPVCFIWITPGKFDARRTADEIEVTASRNEETKETHYFARILCDAIDLSDAAAKRGVRFNLLVNDNDGEMRESFLSIAPGIGREKTFEAYPLVLFE